MKSRDEALDIALNLVTRATKAGASAADAVFLQSISTAAQVRNGEVEDLEQSEGADIGLRVFVGQSTAIVSTTDHSKAALDLTIERAIAMAKEAPEDRYAGLAEPDQLERHPVDLDLTDATDLSSAQLVEMGRECEAIALQHEGITNTEGAGAERASTRIALVTSGGFEGAYDATSFGMSCSVLAGEGLAMERDYSYTTARHFEDMMSAKQVGDEAATRALSRLNPIKPKSAKVPVVFDPRVGSGIVGALAAAVSGAAIARGTSFLKDCLGKQVMHDAITIVDDPRRARGLRSKPFDGEGCVTRPMNIVADGMLKHYFLDSATARQLNMDANGRASRGTSGPPSPSPTNLYMKPGTISREDLIGEIKDGFYVTEMMGQGANMVTGDYSRGAAGFWIRDGQIAEPVSELTIAGNLKEMFMHLTAASDLEFRYGTNAPTLRIDGMMVAGN